MVTLVVAKQIRPVLTVLTVRQPGVSSMTFVSVLPVAEVLGWVWGSDNTLDGFEDDDAFEEVECPDGCAGCNTIEIQINDDASIAGFSVWMNDNDSAGGNG